MMRVFCVKNTGRNPTLIVANLEDEALFFALKLGRIRELKNGTVKDITDQYTKEPTIKEGTDFNYKYDKMRYDSITKILSSSKVGIIYLRCGDDEDYGYKVTSWDEIQIYRQMSSLSMSKTTSNKKKILALQKVREEYEHLKHSDKPNPNINYNDLIKRIDFTITKLKKTTEEK